MAYDPNSNKNPDLRTTPPEVAPRKSSWVPWVAVIAVVLVGAFVWSNMGGTGTDPATTSSTNPPATMQPAPEPAAPAAPAAEPATPATPPATGGSTQP